MGGEKKKVSLLLGTRDCWKTEKRGWKYVSGYVSAISNHAHASPSLLSFRSEVHKLQLFLFFLYVTKLKKSGNEGLCWPSLSVMCEMLSALQKTSQLLKYSRLNKPPLRSSVQLFRNPADWVQLWNQVQALKLHSLKHEQQLNLCLNPAVFFWDGWISYLVY